MAKWSIRTRGDSIELSYLKHQKMLPSWRGTALPGLKYRSMNAYRVIANLNAPVTTVLVTPLIDKGIRNVLLNMLRRTFVFGSSLKACQPLIHLGGDRKRTTVKWHSAALQTICDIHACVPIGLLTQPTIRDSSDHKFEMPPQLFAIAIPQFFLQQAASKRAERSIARRRAETN